MKWSSTHRFAGICRGVGLYITSHTCPDPDKHSPPQVTDSQAQSDKTLVAKRAAVFSSPELLCWVCPSKPCWCLWKPNEQYPQAAECPPQQASQPAPGVTAFSPLDEPGGHRLDMNLGHLKRIKGSKGETSCRLLRIW